MLHRSCLQRNCCFHLWINVLAALVQWLRALVYPLSPKGTSWETKPSGSITWRLPHLCGLGQEGGKRSALPGAATFPLQSRLRRERIVGLLWIMTYGNTGNTFVNPQLGAKAHGRTPEPGKMILMAEACAACSYIIFSSRSFLFFLLSSYLYFSMHFPPNSHLPAFSLSCWRVHGICWTSSLLESRSYGALLPFLSRVLQETCLQKAHSSSAYMGTNLATAAALPSGK